MSDNKHEHKRYLKNYLVNPNFQFKYVLYFISLSIALWGGAFGIGLLKFNEFRMWLIDNNYANVEIIAQSNELAREMTWLTLGALVSFSVLGTLLAIFVSHRVAGPMIAIVQYLEELKKGNYDAVRELRKYDELKPIMDNLKDLNEKIRGK